MPMCNDCQQVKWMPLCFQKYRLPLILQGIFVHGVPLLQPVGQTIIERFCILQGHFAMLYNVGKAKTSNSYVCISLNNWVSTHFLSMHIAIILHILSHGGTKLVQNWYKTLYCQSCRYSLTLLN